MSWQQLRMWASMGNALGVCVPLCRLEMLGACQEGVPGAGAQMRCAQQGRSPEGRWALECGPHPICPTVWNCCSWGVCLFLLPIRKTPKSLAQLNTLLPETVPFLILTKVPLGLASRLLRAAGGGVGVPAAVMIVPPSIHRSPFPRALLSPMWVSQLTCKVGGPSPILQGRS